MKKKIAIFCNGWKNEQLTYVLEGVRKRAAKDNVDIFVYVSYIFSSEKGRHRKNQLNIFHLPDPKEYAGAIMLTNTFNTEDEKERVINLFQRAGVPMLSMEIKIPGMGFVGTDNYHGMYELVEHLVIKHHVKKVVFVRGLEGHEESRIREQAVKDVLKKHGLRVSRTLTAGYEFQNATVVAEKWLQEGRKLPDAFVCANDHMALGLITVFRDHGIEVPRDVIITGFDHAYDGRTSYPLLTTVSRKWEEFGDWLYDGLLEQINHPGTVYEKEFPSALLTSESCGCAANEEDVALRITRFRNMLSENLRRDQSILFFHELRIAMSKVENSKAFHQQAKDTWENCDILGPDFAICVEKVFLESDDEHYPKRIRGYSKSMEVLYEKKAGRSVRNRAFDSAKVYPGYRKEKEGSNIYLVTPLSHMGYVIGYLAIKNHPEIFYDLSVTSAIISLNALFLSIRQYILSQQNVRKLREIYMTDALSTMYNRMGCEQVIFPFIEKTHQEGHPVTVMFVDIDRMKRINDEFGHLSGNLAIRACANAMMESLPKDWLFGRYGGDEFLAAGIAYEDVEFYKQRIRKRLARIMKSAKVNFALDVSIGYYQIEPEDHGTIADFVKLADDSMYEEKKEHHRTSG